ncbi:facilitated trehalose transporter Tret1-like isoform X2 [Pectinophora gossypiella]|uniref:facilitated trehalose transporter Tret1-like isoform X2 n=1 Tax=Pectinophora gossypiella TaxID=13191 RepID=UPI00214E7B3B|nr:facilitated trehalose transporter Tret1-like isoform X2 [Pectinophora gossypiella]
MFQMNASLISVAWTIISLTTYVPLVIAAIGVAGFGAAGQAVSSVYIAEIAQDSIRGGLTSSCVSGYFLGLLFSYIIGGQLTYYQIVYVHLSGSILYIVMLMLLKESPVFLIQKGREEEAAKSIAFYRQVSITSKEVEVAINKIKLQLDPQIDRILAGDNDAEASKELIDKKNPVVEQEQPPPESPWKFLLKSESSKRALGCALFLMASNIMMGAIVLQVYAEPLFTEAVPSMDSNLCAIMLAIDLMVPSLICAVSVDRFGRKFLMTWTSFISGFFTLLLASQLHMHYAPHWVTALMIYAYCFFYNLGAATVPFIVAAEIFLPEIRGLCNSIVMACMWITNFVTLIIFNPLVDNFGLGPLFYGFSAVCFLTAAYSHLFLPETKGLSADAIQMLFLKEKKKTRC